MTSWNVPPGRRRPRGGDSYYDEMEGYAPRSKLPGQRPIDRFSSVIQHTLTCLEHHRTPFFYHSSILPHEYYAKEVLPVPSTSFNPSTALCTQWAGTSFHPDNRQARGGVVPRIALYGMEWSPTGSRLLCTSAKGEFLLLNTQSFGVEVKTMAHEEERPCRALAWGSRTDMIASGGECGKLKLWLPNFVMATAVDSHHRVIRGVSWSPWENKLVSCGQDGSARIWDVRRLCEGGGGGSSSSNSSRNTSAAGGRNRVGGNTPSSSSTSMMMMNGLNTPHNPSRSTSEEGEGGGGSPHGPSHSPTNNNNNNNTTGGGAGAGFTSLSNEAEELRLEGHGGDVTAVEWHPYQALLATGSQDTYCRLWDPRVMGGGGSSSSGSSSHNNNNSGGGRSLVSLQGHRQALTAVRWHPTSGHLLLTAARDGVIRLWDIRRPQSEWMRFHRHTSGVEQVRWHPFCSDLFASAGADGAIFYWMIRESDGVAVHDTLEAIREAAKIEAAHHTFRGHANPIHNISWSPHGMCLTSCCNEVKYWTRSKPGAREERERGGNEEMDILEEEGGIGVAALSG